MQLTQPNRPREQFRSGFFFGLGFCIPFVIGWVFATILSVTLRQAMAPDSSNVPFSSLARLEIVSHEQEKHDGNLRVRGQVANNGSDSWRFVRIVVDLFDRDGHFVWQCSDYLVPNLYPGQTANFVVDCDGSKESPLPDFERYEIEVGNASYISTVLH